MTVSPATTASGEAHLLAGVSVLDLSGPNAQLAGRLVAELGAQVLRLEPPAGDATRHTGPWAAGTADIEGSLTFAALNSGKLSIVLDIDAEDARSTIDALVESVDVVLLSEPSVWTRCISAQDVLAQGRSVVMVHGFGPSGPYAEYLAPEIVTTALGGLLYISGDASLAPCMPPEPLGQYFASVWASLALVSAVWAARTSDATAIYRVSTHEALATQEHLVRAAAMDGESIVRNGSQHKSVAPANVFPTSDGWVYIYVSRNHWAAFLGAWSPHPVDFDDRRWLPNSARRADAKRLNEAVAGWTQGFASGDLVALLQGAGVPCLPVNRPSDFQHDPQVVARELFAPSDHPVLGTFQQMRFPALVDGSRPPTTRPPMLGEHTESILGPVGASKR